MSALSSRELMLGRLRAATVVPSDVADIDRRIDAHYLRQRPSAPRDEAQRVRDMQAAMTAAHADVICADSDAWPTRLAERIALRGVRRLLLDPTRLEGAALARALSPATDIVTFERPLEQWKAELFNSVDAGFTVARSGIAATGTLILAPDAGTPRTVSLVPPLHIALVYADTLHADMHAAVKAECWADGMPSNLVLASSPSKTSDIQQTLAYGAHGPRWLWVVIVTGASA